MNRVLVLGLDGATWSLLRPWIDQGNLPNLGVLQREGVSAVLRSTLPPITSAAWTAFSTGKNPSGTGIYDFYSREPNTYLVRPVTRLQVNGISLWKQLSHYGRKTIAINVPMTYPAENDPNILMIAGIPAPHAHSQGFTNPPDLFERFQVDRDRYRITVRLPDYENRWMELISDLKKMVRERLSVAEILIQKEWDLFFVHFYATDIVQHAFWRFIDINHPQYDEGNAVMYGNGLLEIFSEVDRALGKLLKQVDLGHTMIFVMSDHGFGPNACTIHINRWLQDMGFLRLYPPLTRLAWKLSKILLSKLGLPSERMIGKGMRLLGFIPGLVLPMGIQLGMIRALQHLLSHSPRWSNLLYLWDYRQMFEGMNWKRTRAYSIGTTGLIHVNLRGREPQGVVSPGREYEDVRDAIAAGLLSLTDRNGQKLLDRVYRKEEIYHGPLLYEAPDLIPLSETMGCYFYPFLDREGIVTEAESFRTGNHRIDGILVVNGPSIKKKQRMDKINLMDIAPTILYALGVPLSRDMDGSVAQEIFEPQFLAEHPIQELKIKELSINDRTLSTDDEVQMAKKLKDLGYF
jgi:predicted AlkP superfamily phosphohydrolase/phosphomutase